jgi:hypothetical protein
VGRDGWVGKCNDKDGITITVTIPPAGSPRQRDLAAPFAGIRKLGLVGAVSVSNRLPHEVTLDTANAVLYLVDGTQTFASDPWKSAGAADGKLAAFRPPYRVPAGGKMSLGVVFLPPDTDLPSLDHLRVTLDGKWAEVR